MSTLGASDRAKYIEMKLKTHSAVKIQKVLRGKLTRLRMARGLIRTPGRRFPPASLTGHSGLLDDDNDDDVDDDGVRGDFQATSDLVVASEGESFMWPEGPSEPYNAPDWPVLDSSIQDLQIIKDVIIASEIKVRTVTWNLCGEQPPSETSDVNKLVIPVDKFHIYIIGSEECERSIAESAVITSKKVWEAYLSRCLGSQYVPLRAHTLQAIHIIVFVHKALLPLITCSSSAAVPTGLGQTMGNKGGVGVYLNLLGTSILVVNCHLAAHQNSVKERNADFNKINSRLPALLEKKLTATHPGYRANYPLPTNNSGDASSVASETDRGSAGSDVKTMTVASYADRVVFMGDMNYRIKGNRKAIMFLLEKNMHSAMLSNDQLMICMKKGDIPTDYCEPPLNFRPTYKFDLNSDQYDTGKKKRLPAWTDRILYVDRGLICRSYNADFSLRTSDHRPVFASFDVALEGNSVFEGLAEKYLTAREGQSLKNSQQVAFVSESQVCTIS